MYTVITIAVIFIALVSLLILLHIENAIESIKRIDKKIDTYFNKYSNINQSNTNTIKESIDEGLKSIHAEIKEIARICNDIENSNSESINNYTEMCDDIANINANIVDTKERVEEIKKKMGNKTTARKRIASGYTHVCKCKKDDSITTHKKDDTEIEFDPDKHDLHNLQSIEAPDPQIGTFNPQAGKMYEPDAE